MKFIPELWAESADQKHFNNSSRLISAPGAKYYNCCQTSNVWRRNMSRSRESRPRGSRKQQTKITFAARARTLNRFYHLRQTNLKGNFCRNSTFQVNREKKCCRKTTSYLEQSSRHFCQHFIQRTTQQTFLAMNLASQQKTTKLYFSSQVRKQLTFNGSI